MSAAVVRRFPGRPVPRRTVRLRSGGPPTAVEPPVSNLRIAIVMLLVAETMFFAGLIGAYLVFRFGTATWPPRDLPRLPLGITWANTFVLMASGLTMSAALRACRMGLRPLLARNLLWTAALGTLFVLIQGSEWTRLIHHGLTLSAGAYGATFYVLIGAHALHVVAALAWLGVVAAQVRGPCSLAQQEGRVEAAAIYWFFVCALWIVLFALVYR
jgi:heme/copper-type cytochrome/quinol oxidase subunit 3